MARYFKNKRTRRKKFFFTVLFLCLFVIGIGYSTIGMNLGVGGTISLLGYKPVLTITLDNQNANTPGTTSIYEKLSVGYYLDNPPVTQMTTSTNGITVPTKTGFIFGGYYTGTNGSGTQYIDSTGQLTSSADNTHFVVNGSLYAKWTRIMAENLGYDNTSSSVNCNNAQCMIDYINGIFN